MQRDIVKDTRYTTIFHVIDKVSSEIRFFEKNIVHVSIML